MLERQRTIKKPVSLSGVGLHTGKTCKMTFRPAPENYGIVFRRVDLGGMPEVPADVDHVVDTSRGTTLAVGEVKVHTTEHVLAAIAGLQIDNIIIDLDNIEPPICDGSAKHYVDAIFSAEIETQNAPKDYLVIDSSVHYQNDSKGVDIVALPSNDYRLSVVIDYNNPALGSQHTGLFDLEKEFVPEFSMCRTFCFLHEVEDLFKKGLIKGGNIDNAIVIIDRDLNKKELLDLQKKLGLEHTIFLGNSGIINDGALLFKNEPARHKLLDMIGDLALIGVPLKAQILAARPGHASNIEFAKKIRKLYQQKKIIKKYQYEKKEGVVFDINALHRILPHRYPFLLIDKVIDFQLNEKITAIKNVSINEPYFQGHFPGAPIMPGVLIIEGMAQAGGVLLLDGTVDQQSKLVFFLGINNAKFRKTVLPGDQLRFEVSMTFRKSKICQLKGEAYVGTELVAEAEMTASIADRPKQ
ncbi:MAG: bifunctional UDP-3-O-[3-hydroxymyristoyl] N-acetylglucosamine deacetylase/3-hydroxyacyl-ACP dehydratase [Bacteroidetes bacterium]|nr:bifunctional UDP-3-O-[3-hydroxymyristoyl] N-acetylglucosamine deacetylase/3-hydroxyacyl-ACP dehydratase [Bacteroidota bacterium]